MNIWLFGKAEVKRLQQKVFYIDEYSTCVHVTGLHFGLQYILALYFIKVGVPICVGITF